MSSSQTSGWGNSLRPKIALFLNHPKCSVQCGNGIISSLSSHFDFKIFSKHEVEDDFFDDVSMVCFPGGIGDSDSFDHLMQHHKSRVTEFVNNGGKYLGICMGAYWADAYYFDFLKDARAIQYIKAPNTCTRRPHAKDMPVVWNGQPTKMFFYDGCSFTGNNFETIATYPNGDAMAITQGNIGLIGCHPEADSHWYKGYSWMRDLYQNGRNNKQLLLQFAINLQNT